MIKTTVREGRQLEVKGIRTVPQGLELAKSRGHRCVEHVVDNAWPCDVLRLSRRSTEDLLSHNVQLLWANFLI